MKRETNGKEKEGSNRASFSSKFDTRCAARIGTLLY